MHQHRPPLLVDNYGRVHSYLRISVTDRCNLRCRYCMPAEGIGHKVREELLTFDEIESLARIFAGLGIRKIRLTGGEPLVRNGLESLCARLVSIPGVETLGLSTNGVLLKDRAARLRDAGVRHINVSLDTLRAERFTHISLGANLNAVLEGIEAALGAGFDSVKVNTVMMKGFNDDELIDFVEFAVSRSLNLRFIEFMPFLGNRWQEVDCIPYEEMRRIIGAKFVLVPVESAESVPGPARDFRVAGTNAVIGFITTMTDHFCGSCNRIRLTADGRLRNCLFAKEEFDLRRLLRSGAGQDIIEATVRAAVVLKWREHPNPDALIESQDRAMVAIGG